MEWIDASLETDRHSSASGLALNWRLIGVGLALDWGSIDIELAWD